MADFTLTVYDAARVVASAPNFTDNKTAATASNNYYIPNNGRVVLHAISGAGGNLTVQTPGTVDGLAVTDNVNALVAAKHYVFGPFPPATYNDSQGRLLVTVSANTDLFAVRV
jgi:hypothetical protein